VKRCAWADGDPLLAKYHDEEWGVPAHDDRKLFELLNLEGAQAGLSWLTVLRKREGYREAFVGFDPKKVARFTPARCAKLVKDEGIIRHRGKIDAVVSNAKAFLAVQKEHRSFDRFIWGFTSAREMSKALKKRGFKFVGATICYAFMQAAGIVNDHAPSCFRRRARG
jgi:DNA-3-methyladenine glycosylase I